jgi:hypothetical protein
MRAAPSAATLQGTLLCPDSRLSRDFAPLRNLRCDVLGEPVGHYAERLREPLFTRAAFLIMCNVQRPLS